MLTPIQMSVLQVNEALDSLEKLSSNYYWKHYKREKDYSYCGDVVKRNLLSNGESSASLCGSLILCSAIVVRPP